VVLISDGDSLSRVPAALEIFRFLSGQSLQNMTWFPTPKACSFLSEVISFLLRKLSKSRSGRSRLSVPIKPVIRFERGIQGWCRCIGLGLQTMSLMRSGRTMCRMLVDLPDGIVDLTLFNKLVPFYIFVYEWSNSL